MSQDNEYVISSDEEYDESDQASASDVNEQLKTFKKPRGRPPKKASDEPAVKRTKKGIDKISNKYHIWIKVQGKGLTGDPYNVIANRNPDPEDWVIIGKQV